MVFDVVKKFYARLIGFAIVAVLLIVFIDAVVQQKIADPEPAKPCDEGSDQLFCFTLNTESCHKIWDQYDKECRDELTADPAKVRPSDLIEVKINRCQNRKLIHFLPYSRQNGTTEKCLHYFQSY